MKYIIVHFTNINSWIHVHSLWRIPFMNRCIAIKELCLNIDSFE